MGSAGRAIGPDGKPLKPANNNKNHNNSNNNNNNRNNQKGGKVNKGNRQNAQQNRGNERFRPTGPPPLMSLNGRGPGNVRGGPMPGPGQGGFIGGSGPMMGGPMMGNPMMGNGGPVLNNGPMIGGPMRGSGPDPHGNYGFFRDMPGNRTMGDERNSSNQPAGINSGIPLNKPGFDNANSFGNNNPAIGINNAKATSPTPAPSSAPGEVPGFGNNSSIHELFGKMVWKKMEGLRDQAVIDRLQNRIMNLIHDALADQTGPNNQQNMGNAQYGPGMQMKQQEVNFRNF